MEDIEKFLEDLEKNIKKQKDAVQKAEQLERVKEIARKYKGEDEVISSYELVEKVQLRKDELKIMSDWSGLDRILSGFRLKQLVTISAATKSGKTSFCIDLTMRIKEHSPLWLPFEEGAEELIQKFVERDEEPPLFFTPENITGNTLLWVEKKIIESIAKYNTKVVFIDHLHFIIPFTAERQDLAIGRAMRTLKHLSKKWNICIFIIAHLKKTRLESQPGLEDLRDSSFVAQESDTVIMLYRQQKRDKGQIIITDNVNLSVQANRRTGKTGNVKMVFKDGHFYEEDWHDEKKYITNYE